LDAAVPVTGVSASSWAADPWAGIDDIDGADEEEEEEPEMPLVDLAVVAAFADIVAPRIAPPASPSVTRPADAQSLGFVRISSLNDNFGLSFLPHARGVSVESETSL
jgi:hypothetical protein